MKKNKRPQTKINKVHHTFESFWPFYLSQHLNLVCRRLHIFGTSLAIMILIYSIVTFNFSLIVFCPLIGYLFAWIGHFKFEKNRPATFTYPIWSFMGDFKMFWMFFAGTLNDELDKISN